MDGEDHGVPCTGFSDRFHKGTEVDHPEPVPACGLREDHPVKACRDAPGIDFFRKAWVAVIGIRSRRSDIPGGKAHSGVNDFRVWIRIHDPFPPGRC